MCVAAMSPFRLRGRQRPRRALHGVVRESSDTLPGGHGG